MLLADMYKSAEQNRMATQYFQTLPVSRLIISQYETRTLPKVIIASGKIYNTKSDDSLGDTYYGDMRGSVAKAQISDSINYPNLGFSLKT